MNVKSRFGRIAAAAATVLVAASIVVAGSAPASAATSTMTKTEYSKIHMGDSLARVKWVVGSSGSTPSELATSTTRYVFWPVATHPSDPSCFSWVKVRLKDGVWRVVDKVAYWESVPKVTTDKMTEAEFASITIGMRLSKVQEIAGTNGTVEGVEEDTSAYYQSVMWPIPNPTSAFSMGWVTFKKKKGGDGLWHAIAMDYGDMSVGD